MSLTVMKFEAFWCSPCKALKPVFDKVVAANPDVDFQVVDIDDNPMLAQQMHVAAVPTITFVKDGNVVDTLVGLQREQVILDTINKWK